MKNDNIEPAYEFDPMDDSMNLYESKIESIIEKRLDILKNLNSNEWNDFSDSCYELFNAYKFLVEALLKTGRISNAIRYSMDALEYCQIYHQYVDANHLKRYLSVFNGVLEKYRGN